MGEAQVLGADAGARVRGAWRRPGLGVWGEWRWHLGCRAWACGSLEAATYGAGGGYCRNAVWGEGWPEEKRSHQGKRVAYLLLMAKIITVWEQSMEIVAK